MNNDFDEEKHRRELEAFLELKDSLFEEGSEARTLSGIMVSDILQGTRIIPGPADACGQVPLYLIRAGVGLPPIPLPIQGASMEGIPVAALAVILLHQLKHAASRDDATPLDEGAADAMAKVLQWLGVKAQLEQLLEGDQWAR